MSQVQKENAALNESDAILYEKNKEKSQNKKIDNSILKLLPEANPIAPRNFQEEEQVSSIYPYTFEDLPNINNIKNVYYIEKELLQQKQNSILHQFKDFQINNNIPLINYGKLFSENINLVFARNKQESNSDNYCMNLINIKKIVSIRRGRAYVDNNQQVNKNNTDTFICTENIDENTLIFDSRFESGNLSRASKINNFEYNLLIQNDINTRGYSQWFYFKVQNGSKGKKYKFNLVNFQKSGILFNEGMKITIFSKQKFENQNISWHKGGDKINAQLNNIQYNDGTEQQFYNVSYEYTFEYENDQVYFAYNPPYTYTDLQNYIKDYQKTEQSQYIFSKKLLARTLAGNRVDLLTITNKPNNNTENIKNKNAIIITARVHPGETVSSWAMKGFLDFILGESLEANQLREKFVFKIIPMLNPDGVIHGNYRSSLAGTDLNRRWDAPCKTLHPEIFYSKNAILDIANKHNIMLFIDLHGHSRKKDIFMYGCNDPENPQLCREFPYLLSKIFPSFSYNECNFSVHPYKEGTARVTLWYDLGIHNVFTLESSFCGSSTQRSHFSVKDLELIGKKLCQAIYIKWKVSQVKFSKESNFQIQNQNNDQQKQGEQGSGGGGEEQKNNQNIVIDKLKKQQIVPYSNSAQQTLIIENKSQCPFSSIQNNHSNNSNNNNKNKEKNNFQKIISQCNLQQQYELFNNQQDMSILNIEQEDFDYNQNNQNQNENNNLYLKNEFQENEIKEILNLVNDLYTNQDLIMNGNQESAGSDSNHSIDNLKESELQAYLPKASKKNNLEPQIQRKFIPNHYVMSQDNKQMITIQNEKKQTRNSRKKQESNINVPNNLYQKNPNIRSKSTLKCKKCLTCNRDDCKMPQQLQIKQKRTDNQSLNRKSENLMRCEGEKEQADYKIRLYNFIPKREKKLRSKNYNGSNNSEQKYFSFVEPKFINFPIKFPEQVNIFDKLRLQQQNSTNSDSFCKNNFTNKSSNEQNNINNNKFVINRKQLGNQLKIIQQNQKQNNINNSPHHNIFKYQDLKMQGQNYQNINHVNSIQTQQNLNSCGSSTYNNNSNVNNQKCFQLLLNKTKDKQILNQKEINQEILTNQNNQNQNNPPLINQQQYFQFLNNLFPDTNQMILSQTLKDIELKQKLKIEKGFNSNEITICQDQMVDQSRLISAKQTCVLNKNTHNIKRLWSNQQQKRRKNEKQDQENSQINNELSALKIDQTHKQTNINNQSQNQQSLNNQIIPQQQNYNDLQQFNVFLHENKQKQNDVNFINFNDINNLNYINSCYNNLKKFQPTLKLKSHSLKKERNQLSEERRYAQIMPISPQQVFNQQQTFKQLK